MNEMDEEKTLHAAVQLAANKRISTCQQEVSVIEDEMARLREITKIQNCKETQQLISQGISANLQGWLWRQMQYEKERIEDKYVDTGR